MTALSATLAKVGLTMFFAGAYLWTALFLREVWRDPQGRDIFSFSLNRQWALNGRAMRAAIARGGWAPRLGSVLLALAVSALLGSGLLALAAAFTAPAAAP